MLYSGVTSPLLNLIDDDSVRAWLEEAQEFGFIGPQPVEVQLIHAQAFFEVATSAVATSARVGRVFDLGSGSGLPGLLFGMLLNSDVSVFLVETMEKRVEFLHRWISFLPIRARVSVLHGRAEEIGRNSLYRETGDLVVARGFAGPAVTAECGSALMAVGGYMVVSDPPVQLGQERWNVDGLQKLSLVVEQHVADRANFTVLRKIGPSAEVYPRRVGVPNKKPLF